MKHKKEIDKIIKLYQQEKKEEAERLTKKLIGKQFKEITEFFITLGYKIKEAELKGVSVEGLEDSYF